MRLFAAGVSIDGNVFPIRKITCKAGAELLADKGNSQIPVKTFCYPLSSKLINNTLLTSILFLYELLWT